MNLPLRLRTYICLVLIVLFSSSGNIFLSQGMKQIGAVRVGSAMDLAGILVEIFTNGWIWMGIAVSRLS